jgi:hypothetical protein
MTECTFHASRWLAVRREIAKLADESKDNSLIAECAKMCLAIENMRLDHEEVTLCKCWYMAIAEAK